MVVTERQPAAEPSSCAQGHSLGTIAVEINEAQAQALAAARSSVDHARHVGNLLVEAKRQLRAERGPLAHGEWLPWLAAHCPSIRPLTAQRYMRVARLLNASPGKYSTIRAVLEFGRRRTSSDEASGEGDEEMGIPDPDELADGGSDDDGDYEPDDADEAGDEGADTRTVQLIYDAAAHEEFRRLARELGRAFDTRTQSATVLAVLRHAHTTALEQQCRRSA